MFLIVFIWIRGLKLLVLLAVYSAAFLQFFSSLSVFVDPVSVCLLDFVWWPWMITHRFCWYTVAEFSFLLWVAWFCCFPGGGGTTGCCCRQACDDERGYTRSHDLDLWDLLERFPCSADGGGAADGDEGIHNREILIWYLVIWFWSNRGSHLWFLRHGYVRIYSLARCRPLSSPLPVVADHHHLRHHSLVSE